jgi:hypothetical protein
MTAILETNPNHLAWCIQAVEQAISQRVATLNGQIGKEERQAIADAQLGLAVLKREVTRKANHTRWNKAFAGIRYESSLVRVMLRRVVEFKLPEFALLPVSPINLACPYCYAKPGNECASTADGISAFHVARIKAATGINNARNKKICRKRV